MDGLALLLVIGTSIWVWVDATNIGAGKKALTGIAATKPFVWFLGSLFLWIVFFPLYLFKRGSIMDAAQEASKATRKDTPMLPAFAEGAASDTEQKICPFCAEPVRAAAIKCKHCGSALSAKI